MLVLVRATVEEVENEAWSWNIQAIGSLVRNDIAEATHNNAVFNCPRWRYVAVVSILTRGRIVIDRWPVWVQVKVVAAGLSDIHCRSGKLDWRRITMDGIWVKGDEMQDVFLIRNFCP